MTSTSPAGPANGLVRGSGPATLTEAEERIRNLEAALATRTVIGAAQGMLMERHQLGLDAAFDVLRRVSQHTNVRLSAVATTLVDTGVIAGAGPPGPRVQAATGQLRVVE